MIYIHIFFFKLYLQWMRFLDFLFGPWKVVSQSRYQSILPNLFVFQLFFQFLFLILFHSSTNHLLRFDVSQNLWWYMMIGFLCHILIFILQFNSIFVWEILRKKPGGPIRTILTGDWFLFSCIFFLYNKKFKALVRMESQNTYTKKNTYTNLVKLDIFSL